MEILVVITIWFVLGVVGGLIGQQHGKTGKGFILGFLFGPIGWALMMFDVSMFSLLVTFAAVVMIGYSAWTLFVNPMMERNRKEQEREEVARAKAFEEKMDRAEGKSAQPDPVLNAITAPLAAATPRPTPIPRRTPTPQELANQQAAENSRRALEIYRKYGSQK
jgi:hypothetical protein